MENFKYAADEPATGGLMAQLKQYYDGSPTLQKYTPGAIGGLGGAAIGALATGPRSGENSRQRALRVIRNAAAAGLVGGLGTQAVASGTSTVVDGVNNPADSKPGFLHSILGRAAFPAAIQGSLRTLMRARQRNSLETIFGPAGKVLIGNAKAVAPTSVRMPDGSVQINPGTPAKPGTEIDFTRPTDQANVKGVYEHARRQIIDGMQHDKPGTLAALSNTGKTNMSPADLEAFLKRNFGQSLGQRALRVISPLSTPVPHAGLRRSIGGAGMLASVGSMIYGPAAVDKIWNAVQGGGADAVKHLTVDGWVDKEPPKNPGVWDRLTTGF